MPISRKRLRLVAEISHAMNLASKKILHQLGIGSLQN